MITQTPEQLHFHHIMWQPVFKCMSKCTGCYVRESEGSRYDGPVKTEIIDLIFSSRKVRCDQLTIALDTMYSVPKELKDELYVLWKAYENPKDYYPELYITVNSWNDLQRWKAHLGSATLERFLAPLTAVSLSNFPVLGKICDELREAAEAADTTIIYNSLATEKKRKSKQFEMGVRYSDLTHIIMFKNPLGEEQPVANMANAIMDEFEAKNIKPGVNVKIDQCILDAMHFHKKRHLCSAGIDKVHVWPDGSVSSCPYDSHKKDIGGHFQKEYKTLDELSEIRSKMRLHPYHLCNIRYTYEKVLDDQKELQKHLASKKSLLQGQEEIV